MTKVHLMAAAALWGAATPAQAQPGSAPSVNGPVGTLRASAADVGENKSVRLGLSGELSTAENFLVVGDSGGDWNRRTVGGLTLSGTPLPFLELYARAWGTQNRNRRASEPGRTDPEVIKGGGNLSLGGKAVHALSPRFAVGAAAELGLRPSVAGLSFDAGATSGAVDGLVTWRPLSTLQAHVNAGFVLDNSYDLSAFGTAPPGSQAVSGFAYAAGLSRVRAALAIEGRVPVGAVALRPMAEWHTEVVTASARNPLQSASCGSKEGSCPGGRDQHWLTLGLGVALPKALHLQAGMDFSLREVVPQYGPRLPSHAFVVALSGAANLGAPRVIERIRVVERKVIEVAQPREGSLQGTVVSADGQPVADAVVTVGDALRVVTDAAGTFRVQGLAPGPMAVTVAAPGFRVATAQTTVVAAKESPVSIKMAAQGAWLRGRFVDAAGTGVRGTVRLSGPAQVEVASDDSGAFAVFVPVGAYDVRTTSDGQLGTLAHVEAVDDREIALPVTVRARPAQPTVALSPDNAVTMTKPLRFADAALVAEAADTLDQVVDLLVAHAELTRVRIEVQAPLSVPKDARTALAQARARAVAEALTARGVPAVRIVPVALTDANRRRADVSLWLEP